MPADIKKLIENKDLILSTISSRGPCLPVHISRAVNLSLLFASAYLSELYGENRVKMSNMRVGSSPLYFLSGQEAQLENFIQHLAPKEKEAFFLLKEEKILEDQKLQPAIRFALRDLKDFAIPLKVKKDDEVKLFWKHAFTSDEDTQHLLNQLLSPPQKKKEKFEKKQKEEKLQMPPLPALNTSDSSSNLSTKLPSLAEKEKQPLFTKAISEKQEKPLKKLAIIKKLKESDIIFTNKIKNYLMEKNMELLELIIVKKNESHAKIRIDTPLGKQELFLIMKDKKKITEDDLAIAIHRAQLEKMPALFLSPGVLNPIAQEYAKTWRNLIKVEKVKL